MKNLILSLGLIMIFLINVYAQSLVGIKQSCKLKIGDKHASGIVFYLDTTGGKCHGLVCAPYDQSKGCEMGRAVTLCKSLRLGNYSNWRLPSKDELHKMYTNLYKAGLGGLTAVYWWSSTEGNSYGAWFEDVISHPDNNINNNKHEIIAANYNDGRMEMAIYNFESTRAIDQSNHDKVVIKAYVRAVRAF